MTQFDLKRLYELLPAIYRIRDAELGLKNNKDTSGPGDLDAPLKSLLSIIADEVAILEENLDQLYDDQFIETCAPWVIPYLGQLVGYRSLTTIPNNDFSQRSEVANTITYRRRKGTAAVIEQLSRDITGWDANVVEYFRQLATTPYLNNLRPDHITIFGVRNQKKVAHLNSPFNALARSIDVRRIVNQAGKYNIPNIGIFLWRINNYAITKAVPFKIDERRYTFDPLGRDMPLYNQPEPETSITQHASRLNVPAPISREEMKQNFSAFYGNNKSVLLYNENQPYAIIGLLSHEVVRDLSDLHDENGETIGWKNLPETENQIAIDPQLGRIGLPPNFSFEQWSVNYQYGFSGDLGGGTYDRSTTFTSSIQPVITITNNGSIQQALDQLKESGGIIEIADNRVYEEPLNIQIPAGVTIELRAANRQRPILKGGIKITGTDTEGQLILNGLMLADGFIEVESDCRLSLLQIIHCTQIPTQLPELILAAPLTFCEIDKCILGRLRVAAGTKIVVNNSIVDATDQTAIAYAALAENESGGTLQIQNSTVIGRVYTQWMEKASNCIFMAKVHPDQPNLSPIKAARLQEGCVRFSYVPPEAQLPNLYRCQPNPAIEDARVRPIFTSLTFGNPGYGQLNKHCASEITKGADDESEMGAFHHLYQFQRINNLRVRLNEYLRFGLEAGIFYGS